MSSSKNSPDSPPEHQQQNDDRKSSEQLEEGEISPPIQGDEGEGKKRGRENDQGVDIRSSSSSKPRRKGELDVSSRVEPICYVCKKRFGSWKAVFGHLRAHPRDHPGAFPPPIFSRDDGATSSDNNVAKQVGQGQNQSTPDLASGDVNSSRKGLEIDLNKPIGAGGPAEEESDGGGNGARFDLNKPPKDEEDSAAN